MNIPSTMQQSGVHLGGSWLVTTGVSLYLDFRALVVKHLFPLMGIPSLSAIAKGSGMYCSAITSTGFCVFLDHFSFFMQAFFN